METPTQQPELKTPAPSAVAMATHWPGIPGPHELAAAALAAAGALRPSADPQGHEDGRILKRLTRAPGQATTVTYMRTADAMLEELRQYNAQRCRNGLTQLSYTETPQADNGFMMWHHQWLADHPDWIGTSAKLAKAQGRHTLVMTSPSGHSVKAIIIMPEGMDTGTEGDPTQGDLEDVAARAVEILKYHGAQAVTVEDFRKPAQDPKEQE